MGTELEDSLKRSLCQLAVLALLEVESQRHELVKRLQALGIEMDEGQLCRILRRLEQRGLLKTSKNGTRASACPIITDEGRRVRSRLIGLWAGLQSTLDALSPAGGSPQKESGTNLSLSEERAALAAERQKVERLRSDLLSTVSHELRTPLTLIRTSIGLLLDSAPDPVMRDRLLRNIKQSADRMHVLVTDLLDLVRLQSGHPELQMRYLDAGDLVAGAATLMRPLLDEKTQTLELDIPTPAPRLMGDHRRLEQVLLNLLSNANKFAPPGAHIRVCVTADEGTVVVGVSDTGPGIPPEAQEHLFEQFYTARTSSPSRNIGAGLGLPIAKGIVEAHGGRMWVESEVGVGSTFYFELPKEGTGKGETG